MAKFSEKEFGAQPKEYDLSALLSEGESVLWRGKPNRKAFLFSQAVKMLPFALLWLLIDGSLIGMFVGLGIFSALPPAFAVFLVVFFLFHLIPVWIWAGNLLTAGKRQKNMEYALTDRRIVMKSGLIGIDVVNIFYTEVEAVNLRVGFTDKLFHVGDIYLTCSAKAQVMWDIDDPYAVVTMLQKIVGDIKADIHFPNGMRPDQNPGYEVSYRGKGTEEK